RRSARRARPSPAPRCCPDPSPSLPLLGAAGPTTLRAEDAPAGLLSRTRDVPRWSSPHVADIGLDGDAAHVQLLGEVLSGGGGDVERRLQPEVLQLGSEDERAEVEVDAGSTLELEGGLGAGARAADDLVERGGGNGHPAAAFDVGSKETQRKT